jgi:hypothetical protein
MSQINRLRIVEKSRRPVDIDRRHVSNTHFDLLERRLSGTFDGKAGR